MTSINYQKEKIKIRLMDFFVLKTVIIDSWETVITEDIFLIQSDMKQYGKSRLIEIESRDNERRAGREKKMIIIGKERKEDDR